VNLADVPDRHNNIFK